MDELSEFNWKYGLLLIIGFWVVMDVLVLLINLAKRSGPGGCSSEIKGGWVVVGVITGLLKDKCTVGDTGSCTDLGKWSEYGKTTKEKTDAKLQCLCHDEVDAVWKEAVDQNVVSGYNTTQLLAYVIVPTITVLGIAYGFLATNLNKSEWTFWIMIATIIGTSITSLAYDTDMAILPQTQNPLELVTSKLGLGTADELEFSFISRKQDGDECMVNGTVYGPSAAKIDNEPITYSGECKEKEFL